MLDALATHEGDNSATGSCAVLMASLLRACPSSPSAPSSVGAFQAPRSCLCVSITSIHFLVLVLRRCASATVTRVAPHDLWNMPLERECAGQGGALWTFLEGIAAAADVPAFVAGTPFGLPPVHVTCPLELIPLLAAEEGEGSTVNHGKGRRGQGVKSEGVEAGCGRGGREAEGKDEGSEGTERGLSEDEGAEEGEVGGEEHESLGLEAMANGAGHERYEVDGKKASVPASVVPINKKKLKRERKAARKAAAATAAAALEAAAGR